jgi:hypothetical protein
MNIPWEKINHDGERRKARARICKRLRSPGINSARLGIDFLAPLRVYKYGLRTDIFGTIFRITN